MLLANLSFVKTSVVKSSCEPSGSGQSSWWHTAIHRAAGDAFDLRTRTSISWITLQQQKLSASGEGNMTGASCRGVVQSSSTNTAVVPALEKRRKNTPHHLRPARPALTTYLLLGQLAEYCYDLVHTKEQVPQATFSSHATPIPHKQTATSYHPISSTILLSGHTPETNVDMPVFKKVSTTNLI